MIKGEKFDWSYTLSRVSSGSQHTFWVAVLEHQFKRSLRVKLVLNLKLSISFMTFRGVDGETNTASGIDQMISMFNNEEVSRTGVKNRAILVTDGGSSATTAGTLNSITSATRAKNLGRQNHAYFLMCKEHMCTCKIYKSYPHMTGFL